MGPSRLSPHWQRDAAQSPSSGCVAVTSPRSRTWMDGPQPRRARLQRHALVDHVDERRRKAAEAAQLRHKHIVVGGLVDWVWAGVGHGWDPGLLGLGLGLELEVGAGLACTRSVARALGRAACGSGKRAHCKYDLLRASP